MLVLESCNLHAVDAGGHAGGAEPVVNVDDAHIGGATVEHAQQGRDTAETRTVSDARRHGDDGRSDESSDDAGQGAFHSGDTDDDAGGSELVPVAKQTVESGDTNVVNGFGAIAERAGGHQGFFRDGDVACAGGDDENRALSANLAIALDDDGARKRMEPGCAREAFDGGVDAAIGASDENIVAGMPASEHGTNNFGDLLRRFATPENDLSETLAERTVMVDLGEAQVLEGQMAEPLERSLFRHAAGANSAEEFANGFLIQGGLILSPQCVRFVRRRRRR